mgnify:CR=1 FL=1
MRWISDCFDRIYHQFCEYTFVPDYCLVKETAAFQLDLVEELPPRQLVVAHSSHLPIPQAAKEFMSMLEKGAE